MIESILQVGFVIIFVLSIFHWVRTGFWVPKYIHGIAAIMFISAIFLFMLANSVNDRFVFKTIYIIIGFPLAVYVIYGIYGGGLVSKNIKVNDYFTLDRAMLREEVVFLLKELFLPYQNWSYNNLLLLSANENASIITGKSGRKYLFKIIAIKSDGCDFDSKLILRGELSELDRMFYRPKSIVQFQIAKNGEICNDGLKTSI